MSQTTGSEPFGDRIAVGLIIERGVCNRGAWSVPSTELAGVVCGEAMRAPAPQMSVLREEGEHSRQLWKGFEIRLYPDAAESYWFNLTSPNPSLFVVCREDEDGVQPALVTLDHQEAHAHLEADDQVLSIALPAELHPVLERYVLEHYRPAPHKKRRRSESGENEGQT